MFLNWSSPRGDKAGNQRETLNEYFSRRIVQSQEEDKRTSESSSIQKDISSSLEQQTDIIQELAKKVYSRHYIRFGF